MAKVIHSQLPIRQQLIELANILPKSRKYYAFDQFTNITIIANNLADAFVLFYDYQKLNFNIDNYDFLQQMFNNAVATKNIKNITLEWLEDYNDDETDRLSVVNNLPTVISQDHVEGINFNDMEDLLVKSAVKH